MEIIESWQDHHEACYAIVRHGKEQRLKWHIKEFEALWLDDDGELSSFGGSVGYRLADYDTVEEARRYLLRGISECEQNLDIWHEMLEV